jgi:hypothetical protein
MYNFIPIGSSCAIERIAIRFPVNNVALECASIGEKKKMCPRVTFGRDLTRGRNSLVCLERYPIFAELEICCLKSDMDT